MAQFVGILASTLAALVGALFAAFARRKPETKASEGDPSPDQLVRLDEVRAALKEQERIASRNRWSNNFLVFSQFVIGAVLATSFAQSQLPPSVVGLLGILVLASSIMQRQFRPDVRARDAKRQCYGLRRVLRDTENQLLDMKEGIEGAPSIAHLRREVSARLCMIEEQELENLAHTAEAVRSRLR
ncbi:MAG TPA: hypothetical protein VFZ91_14410 [Allosphingosinicella sp.]